MTLEQRNLMVLDTLEADIREMASNLEISALVVGIVLIFTQGYRTFEEQGMAWAKGRTDPGEPCLHNRVRYAVGHCPTSEHPLGATVTNAKPGFSPHNWKRAFDVAIKDFPGDTTPDNVYDGPWAQVGHMGEMMGLQWGGRWRHPDIDHFELMETRTYAGLLSQFPQGLG